MTASADSELGESMKLTAAMRIALLMLTGLAIGCSGSGPASTDTVSSSLQTLESRVEFLERHVTFRRTYRELEFHIVFHNNSSGLPGPSEWDVRLVARVPPDELTQWIPAGVQPLETADTDWLSSVPQPEKAVGITEWYSEPRRVIGIDRKESVVVYRVWKY